MYVDGGIRRGTDVFKALARGAKAVFIGRPALWGLAYKVRLYYNVQCRYVVASCKWVDEPLEASFSYLLTALLRNAIYNYV